MPPDAHHLYPNPAPGLQTAFNLAHSRTRVKVEQTFGILKSRFQCLRGLRVCPERACDIIVACAVLHNIATLRKEIPPPLDTFLEDEPIPQMDARAGQMMRDHICTNHFNIKKITHQTLFNSFYSSVAEGGKRI